jgi:hypothetical protein
MKLTNREKILLPLVLFAVIATLFINFVYNPLNREIKNLMLQAEELEIQLQDAIVKQAQVDKLKNQIVLLQDDIKTNNEDILTIWDQAELLILIEKSMTSLCKKEAIDFFDVVATETLQAGDVNVVINTDYYNLQRLFKKLEEADYFNIITNFNIEKPIINTSVNSEGKKELEVSMNIRFYSIDLEQQFPEKYSFMNGKFGKAEIFE